MKARVGHCFGFAEGDQDGLLLLADLVGGAEGDDDGKKCCGDDAERADKFPACEAFFGIIHVKYSLSV